MNPVFELANAMQTPNVQFEARMEANKKILAELNKREAPACPRGLIEYEWEQDHFTIICHLDYEAPERGSRCDGQQQEPDVTANMTLHAAYIGSLDISGQLSPEAIEAVEILALGEKE